MSTRRQRYLAQALKHVTEVKQLPGEHAEDAKDIYGRLCHKLPILIRTNGLIQTLAFVEEKAGGGQHAHAKAQPRAYYLLKQHVAETLDVPTNGLLGEIQQASTPRYARHTQTLLDAWVYYKRLSVSILDVKADGDLGRGEEG